MLPTSLARLPVMHQSQEVYYHSKDVTEGNRIYPVISLSLLHSEFLKTRPKRAYAGLANAAVELQKTLHREVKIVRSTMHEVVVVFNHGTVDFSRQDYTIPVSCLLTANFAVEETIGIFPPIYTGKCFYLMGCQALEALLHSITQVQIERSAELLLAHSEEDHPGLKSKIEAKTAAISSMVNKLAYFGVDWYQLPQVQKYGLINGKETENATAGTIRS